MKFIKLEEIQQIFSKLSKRERNIVYIGVFLIALFILDRVIIYPVYSKIRSLNDELKEKELSITRDLRIASQKEKIIHETVKYASFLSSPKSEEEATTSLLKAIEGLANESSLYIIDMKPAGLKEDKSNIKKYLVSLSCEGQMEQVMKFMYDVENSNELLAIEKYQINPKTRESSVVQISMTISKIFVP
jgi:Tfp pilus assembly protein PilO